MESDRTWDLSSAPIEHFLHPTWDSGRDFTIVAVLPASLSPEEFAPHATDTRRLCTHPMPMPFPMSRIAETPSNPLDVPRVRVRACGRGTFTPQSMPLLNALTPRFPNLHVTQSIKRPQLGAPGGRVTKTVQCEGAIRCRGKVVAKCYSCGGFVRRPQRWPLCAMPGGGGAGGGGGGGGGGGPQWGQY